MTNIKNISDFRVIDVRSGDIQDEYKRKSESVHYLINLKVRDLIMKYIVF